MQKQHYDLFPHPLKYHNIYICDFLLYKKLSFNEEDNVEKNTYFAEFDKLYFWERQNGYLLIHFRMNILHILDFSCYISYLLI